MEKFKIKVGETYGDLKCIKIVDGYFHLMECIKCGRRKKMLNHTVKVKSGITHKSCGKGLKTKDKVFYSRWCAMRTRTNNKNYWAYKHYGGRGINSDAFENFIDFYDAMYESFIEHSKIHGKKNTSLDRIDVNKNYTKENCRWVQLKKQNGNVRKAVKFKAISPNGEVYIEKNFNGFCKKHKLNPSTSKACLKKGGKCFNGWVFERLNN